MNKVKLAITLAGLALPLAAFSQTTTDSTSAPAMPSSSGDPGTPASSVPPQGFTGTDSMRNNPADTSTTGTSGKSGTPSNTVTGSTVFQTLDVNRDGFLSAQEAAKTTDTKSNFSAMDTNGDSKISATEWQMSNNR